LYATGGVAWADIHFKADLNCPANVCLLGGVPSGAHAPVDFSKTRTGWVIGGGFDYKPWGNNFTVGVEYLNYHFEHNDNVGAAWLDTPTGAPRFFGLCNIGAPCQFYNFGDVVIQTVRARFSYQF
jgi:opacity protein-like surface antigen